MSNNALHTKNATQMQSNKFNNNEMITAATKNGAKPVVRSSFARKSTYIGQKHAAMLNNSQPES